MQMRESSAAAWGFSGKPNLLAETTDFSDRSRLTSREQCRPKGKLKAKKAKLECAIRRPIRREREIEGVRLMAPIRRLANGWCQSTTSLVVFGTQSKHTEMGAQQQGQKQRKRQQQLQTVVTRTRVANHSKKRKEIRWYETSEMALKTCNQKERPHRRHHLFSQQHQLNNVH